MSFLSFWFGSKKKDNDLKVTEDIKLPERKPVKTYTFAYKFEVEYNSGKDGTQKYGWTSAFHLDYQKALAESRRVIKDIVTDVNKALELNTEHIFIIDASIKTQDFIKASATDVVLIEFHDGIAARAMDIEVPVGKDFIITTTTTEEELCKMLGDGVFKIMKSNINW